MDTIRRRVVVTIELNADSWQDAADAMNDIRDRLVKADADKEADVRSLGSRPDSHWTMKGNEDASIDHDSYMAKLRLILGRQGFEPLY